MPTIGYRKEHGVNLPLKAIPRITGRVSLEERKINTCCSAAARLDAEVRLQKLRFLRKSSQFICEALLDT